MGVQKRAIGFEKKKGHKAKLQIKLTDHLVLKALQKNQSIFSTSSSRAISFPSTIFYSYSIQRLTVCEKSLLLKCCEQSLFQ